jgi:hypothetical protein
VTTRSRTPRLFSLLLGGGLLLAAAAIGKVAHRQVLLRNAGVPAQATVTSYQCEGGSGRAARCVVYYRFEVAGLAHYGQADTTEWFENGVTVPVIYLPEHPEVSTLTTKHAYAGAALAVFLCLALAIAGGSLLILSVRQTVLAAPRRSTT